MKLYATLLAVSVAALVLVGVVTFWMTPHARHAAGLAAEAELAPCAAVEEALAAKAPEPPADVEPFEFVGLHAGMIMCEPTDFNLGLAGLDKASPVSSNDRFLNVAPVSPTDITTAAAVPEPITLGLLAVGTTVLLRRRRQSLDNNSKSRKIRRTFDGPLGGPL